MEQSSAWAARDGLTATALRLVFARLEARALAAAGGVCRAWRAAAADAALWRRTLPPHPPLPCPPHRHDSFCWREEAVRVAAGWRLAGALAAAAGGGALNHGALHAGAGGALLALAADDGAVAVWERGGAEGAWRLRWRVSLAEQRGWSSAHRVQWAPVAVPAAGSARAEGALLAAGALALAACGEACVLDSARGRVLARVACSAAAACWLTPTAFLSLELRVFAPRISLTTVWLNATSQEVQSEHAGVAAPLFNIYNEAQTHITHCVVLETSEDTVLICACGDAASNVRGEARALAAWPVQARAPPPLAVHTDLRTRHAARRATAAAAAVAAAAGEPPPPPPPAPSEPDVRALCSPPAAALPLPARVLGLRPACGVLWVTTMPVLICVSPSLLPLRVLSVDSDPQKSLWFPYFVQSDVSSDFIVSPAGDGSSRVHVWSARSGAACVPPAPAAAAAAAAAAAGAGLPVAALLPPPPPARCGDARAPHTLLVLSDSKLLVAHWTIAIWRRLRPRGTARPEPAPPLRSLRSTAAMLHRSLRGSLRALTPLARTEHAPPPTPQAPLPLPSPPLPDACVPRRAPPCPPCPPTPRPACRAAPATRVRALRVACCPPPLGRRPPCAPPAPTCTLTCANFTAPPPPVSSAALATQMTAALEKEDTATCGIERDHVAQRLAAAKCIRRASYLREVAERRPALGGAVPREPYRLDAERACACATDGRVYAIAGPAPARAGLGGGGGCAPDRTPPLPRCVELVPDNECQVATGDGIDPCAHQPRIFLEINRNNQKAITEHQIVSEDRVRGFGAGNKAHAFEADKAACIEQSKRAECSAGQHADTPPPPGFASRIMNSLSLGRGTTSTCTSSAKLGSASGSASGAESDGGASCPARACGAHCRVAPGAARRAGDRGWCASPPAPAPPPPRCRPPSLAERLRRRAGPCSNLRRLHTAAPFYTKSAEASVRDVKEIVAETKANAEKLTSVLRERERFAEAGRGRVASGGNVAQPPGGHLDMPVPPGAARLRVRVDLEGGSACAPRCPAPSTPPAPAAPACSAASSHALCKGVAKPSSWLSRLISRPKNVNTLKAKGTSPCETTGPVKTSAQSPCSPRPASPALGANAKPCQSAMGVGGKSKKSGSDAKKKPCGSGSRGALGAGSAGGGEEGAGGRCEAPCRPPPCAGPPPRAPCDPPSTRCAAPLDALAYVISVHT